MRRRWLRAALLVALPGVSVTAGFYAFLTDQRIAAARRAERAFDTVAWRITVSLAELRAGQQAYFAAGQDRDYWVAEVAGRIGDVQADLALLSTAATLPAAIDALDEAASFVETLARMDERARDHAAAGEELTASDLVFADGLELGLSAAEQVEQARRIERDARDAAGVGRRQLRLVALGGALGAGVAFALLLSPFPAGRPPAEAAEDPAVGAPGNPASPASEGRLFLDLESAGDPPAAAEPAPETPAAAPAPDLRRAAELCGDLGRSANAAELPPLLARAAELLNASCIILWVRDGSGNALRPAIAHGYPEAALARLGTIPCDADNMTAAAWRDERMRVVSGDRETPGAIVIPLVSPEERVGVMSLEVRDGWESGDAEQATAAIVAAQLATRVAADPADTPGGRART